MAKLLVSTFVGEGSMWLYLDNELIMQDSDSVALDLEDGREYVVYWFIQGAPGSSYSITISSPREALFQLTRAIGKGRKGYGALQFDT